MFDLSSEGYLFFEKMAINKNENRPPCFLCEDLVQTTNTFPDMTFSGQSEEGYMANRRGANYAR